MSQEYADMITAKGGKKLANQVLLDLHQQAKNQVDMMFDVARQSPSDELLHAVIEAFSMSNNITNWKDFICFWLYKSIR